MEAGKLPEDARKTPMAHDPHGGHDGSLDYHRRMLADVHRVAAYERALRALVRPGDVVLDLGAGTGLLSMLAARRGARVHAVESMPIAAAARRLIADNGLSDRVAVHHADVRALAPIEPVDLIVSDFMGRFLVDDMMLQAMDAALGWLKPGGRCCPSRVTLRLAPVAFEHLAALDTFALPVGGLDLRSLEATAMASNYPVAVAPGAVLAEPAAYHDWTPAGRHAPFDRSLRFEITRPGRLRGLAGWFDADLADGVALSTAPGVETHWDQLLFPVPATRVAAGDEVEVRLWVDAASGAELWRWEGAIHLRDAAPVPFAFTNVGHLEAGPPRVGAPLERDALEALNEAGARAIETGDHGAAVDAFTRAVRGLGPHHDALAGALWENLGVACTLAGDWTGAVHAFLRALDGALDGGPPDAGADRVQSARLLVDACRRANRPRDAERYARAAAERFGLPSP